MDLTPQYTIAIGLHRNNGTMVKLDNNMKKMNVIRLPFTTEGSKHGLKSCSTIDGEFIWMYRIKNGKLHVGCIIKNGVWPNHEIGLVPVKTTVSFYAQTHFAWVLNNGNFCITNDRRPYMHESDSPPSIIQISTEHEPVEDSPIFPKPHNGTTKIIGHYEWKHCPGSRGIRDMRSKKILGTYENIWEYPNGLSYPVELPDYQIEFDDE